MLDKNTEKHSNLHSHKYSYCQQDVQLLAHTKVA